MKKDFELSPYNAFLSKHPFLAEFIKPLEIVLWLFQLLMILRIFMGQGDYSASFFAGIMATVKVCFVATFISYRCSMDDWSDVFIGRVSDADSKHIERMAKSYKYVKIPVYLIGFAIYAGYRVLLWHVNVDIAQSSSESGMLLIPSSDAGWKEILILNITIILNKIPIMYFGITGGMLNGMERASELYVKEQETAKRIAAEKEAAEKERTRKANRTPDEALEEDCAMSESLVDYIKRFTGTLTNDQLKKLRTAYYNAGNGKGMDWFLGNIGLQKQFAEICNNAFTTDQLVSIAEYKSEIFSKWHEFTVKYPESEKIWTKYALAVDRQKAGSFISYLFARALHELNYPSLYTLAISEKRREEFRARLIADRELNEYSDELIEALCNKENMLPFVEKARWAEIQDRLKLEQKNAPAKKGEAGEQNVQYILRWWAADSNSILMEKDCISPFGTKCIRLMNKDLIGEPQEFDHVLVTPAGVIHIETKTYSGTLTVVTNDTWMRYGEKFTSPASQVRRHDTLMRSIVPNTRVYSLICIADEKAEIRDDENSEIPIVTIRNLESVLTSIIENTETRLSEEEMSQIAEKINSKKVQRI